jgi:hypothetical protein
LSLGSSCGLCRSARRPTAVGSTGSLGAFNPSSNTTVTLPADGILNYTTVTIPAGITVKFTLNAANTPVTLLATGDVTIAGTIDVQGAFGLSTGNVPANGGPSGFKGGLGGSPPSGGAGLGGGAPSGNATYGASNSFVSLLPLFGGSGGGGGTTSTLGSTGGGGGGGAIVIASSTRITLSGSINANGGSGATSAGGSGFNAGGGSGGAIRLVAPQVVGSGQLLAIGGTGTGTSTPAGSGRIRIESFTVGFTGGSSPSAFFSSAPGPVASSGNPGLINLPTLTITSVGAITAPSTPGGLYTSADLTLPGGTANPVPVVLTATNTPPGSAFSVRVAPRSGTPSTAATTTNSGGTFASSSYTANVTLPNGQVSVLNAFGTFTLPLLASLMPLIDGEPVEQIMVAATYGGPSTVSIVTKSGKTVLVDQLPTTDQLRLAVALAASEDISR